MSERFEKDQDDFEGHYDDLIDFYLPTSSLKEKWGHMKWLERALRKGKITQEFYDSESKRIEEEFSHAWFAETQEQFKKMSGKDNPTLDMKNGHIVIKLVCPRCKTEGENTCGRIQFGILGKDKEGHLYFECPQCKEHLQYDPMSGRIRIRKGLLGFLFGKFR